VRVGYDIAASVEHDPRAEHERRPDLHDPRARQRLSR
jgi:hypothetical protein